MSLNSRFRFTRLSATIAAVAIGVTGGERLEAAVNLSLYWIVSRSGGSGRGTLRINKFWLKKGPPWETSCIVEEYRS